MRSGECAKPQPTALARQRPKGSPFAKGRCARRELAFFMIASGNHTLM